MTKVGMKKTEPSMIRRQESLSFIRDVRQISCTTEQVVGYLGEVHPQVADNLWNRREGLCGGLRYAVHCRDRPPLTGNTTGIARFPAVTRDISHGSSERDSGRPDRRYDHPERRKDLWKASSCSISTRERRSEQGYKSMAYSVVFRAKDKTLEEAEISGCHEEDFKRTVFYGN